MPSNDENISDEVLARFRSWLNAGTELSFSLRGPSDGRWDLPVTVFDLSNESVAFRWLLPIGVTSPPSRTFAVSEGKFVIWFEGSTATLSDNLSSVLIARDPYRCVLTTR